MDTSLFIQKNKKGYMFYRLTHSIIIVETRNVRFIENGETNENEDSQNVRLRKLEREFL